MCIQTSFSENQETWQQQSFYTVTKLKEASSFYNVAREIKITKLNADSEQPAIHGWGEIVVSKRKGLNRWRRVEKWRIWIQSSHPSKFKNVSFGRLKIASTQWFALAREVPSISNECNTLLCNWDDNIIKMFFFFFTKKILLWELTETLSCHIG